MCVTKVNGSPGVTLSMFFGSSRHYSMILLHVFIAFIQYCIDNSLCALCEMMLMLHVLTCVDVEDDEAVLHERVSQQK